MGKAKTHDEFISEISHKNPNIEILGTYINSTTKIHCRCKVDGCEWYPRPYVLVNGQGCPECGLRKCKNHKRKSHEKFVSELSELLPTIEVIGRYVNTLTPIECRCTIHNHIWKARPNDLLRGHGCSICGRLKANNSHRLTHDEFLDKLYGLHYNIVPLEQYKGMNVAIDFKCNQCGTIWTTSPNNVVNNGTGCPGCNISKGESLVRTYLLANDIKYIPQYTFEDCKYKKCLPFDFAIFMNDMLVGLIEYDGEQHFHPVKYFGGINYFDEIKRNDKIKTEYAYKNNIKLLRLNYMQSKEQVFEELASFIDTIYK